MQETQAVYTANDIVYYEEGKDFTYGEGTKEEEHSLQEAQAQLKLRVAPETFQAYELYAVQNRPVKKVAEYLDCSENQVYQAKKRCFKMLQEIIIELNSQDPALKLEWDENGI